MPSTRPTRLRPEVRRGLILDTCERLLAEGDPLLLKIGEVSEAAGVSRPLVHAYFGDRRGIVDAVQARLVGRLDTWTGHGLRRAGNRSERLRALVTATFSFVEAERDAWNVLLATGGLDHPSMHALRSRWAADVADEEPELEVSAQAAVAALLLGVGPWVTRGTDVDLVHRALTRTLRPDQERRVRRTDG